ncbi:MAG: MFS transporter [Lachnospiraceae bacterium]
MTAFFIFIIYLAFISLGLPDSLLGTSWPLMRQDLGLQLGAAGIIAFMTSMGTIISSLMSGRLVQRFGTGKIVFVSCLMTAAALLGFSRANSFEWLILCGIPLGLGGGAVDAVLNHYVAEYYEAHHMSWLHACWGIGATVGPLIMSYFIASQQSWRMGYATVSKIQFVLVVVLLCALPFWKKVAEKRRHSQSEGEMIQNETGPSAEKSILHIPGVPSTLLTFMFYCGGEIMVGLWGASYLVTVRGIASEQAAGWISLYYLGITLGRIASGFITVRIDNRHLILYGQIFAVAGVLLILIPFSTVLIPIGLVMIGVGFAPVFPGLIYLTPRRFGSSNSARLIGYQMATAYAGNTFLPLIFGAAATFLGIGLFPFILLIFILTMIAASENIVRKLGDSQKR